MLAGLDAGTRWPAMHPSHVKTAPPPINHLPLTESKQFVVHPLAFAADLGMLGEAPRHGARCGRMGKQRAAARRNWKHLHAYFVSSGPPRDERRNVLFGHCALLGGLPQKKKFKRQNNPSIGGRRRRSGEGKRDAKEAKATERVASYCDLFNAPQR